MIEQCLPRTFPKNPFIHQVNSIKICIKRRTGSMICYDSAARIDSPNAFTNHNIARRKLSSRSLPQISREKKYKKKRKR